MKPLFILLTLFLAGLLPNRAAEFEYGAPPAECVLDVPAILGNAELQSISRPLVAIQKNEGIDIYAVILPTLDGAPAKFIAANFAKAWCNTTIHAIILHVPAHPDSPWIFPGGSMVADAPKESLDSRIATAVRHARAEHTDTARIRTAAIETADTLRYLAGTRLQQDRALDVGRRVGIAQAEKKYISRKVMLYGIPAALFALLLAGLAVWHIFRTRRANAAPRQFSTTMPPRRLGAPHTGGNHVVCRLSDPRPAKSGTSP